MLLKRDDEVSLRKGVIRVRWAVGGSQTLGTPRNWVFIKNLNRSAVMTSNPPSLQGLPASAAR